MTQELTMESAEQTALSAIDRATLTPLVRSALNNNTLEVVDWDVEQLAGGFGLVSAVYRVTGHARDHDRDLHQTLPWSVILKALCPVAGTTQVSSSHYYKRDLEAYRSGWLNDLPGGLVAPRCYAIVEHPNGCCSLWLEEVADDIGSRWPLEHYGIAARHAGQLNGAYLADRPMPSWPWLSSGWLRAHIERSAPAIPMVRASLDHPLIRRWLPATAMSRFFQLWEERERFYDALDRLPQTLCHLDYFRRNLFARETEGGDYRTAAVDWAFTGWGAIGEELVSLIVSSCALFEVDLDRFAQLEDIVFEGYLAGLDDAGWKGDLRQVRLGYAAASLRWRFCDLWKVVPAILDESQHQASEEAIGLSMEEIEDHFAAVGELVDQLTDEVGELMDAIG